jgi:hypothetical protein
MSVVYNKIELKKFPVYSPDDTLIGECNELEFMNIAIQIAEQQLDGCYVLYNGEKRFIESCGSMYNRPDGLFDEKYKLLRKLLNAQMEARKNKRV